MKKQKYSLLILIILVIILIGIGQFIISGKIAKVIPPSSVQRDTFTLKQEDKSSTLQLQPTVVKNEEVIIDFADGRKIKEQLVAKTVDEALLKVAENNNLTVESKEYKFGKMVTRIGDKSNSNSFYWMYSVNDKAGTIACDRFLIYPGDKVEWRYEKMNQ